MRRRDTRVKIAPGIYRDACWWYGTVHVRGAGELNPKTGKRKAAFREKRFALAQPITDVQAWRERTRAQLLDQAERGSAPGTFARDAVHYLNAFTAHLASKVARKVEIHAWVREFGDRPRGTIRPADVARVRTKWLTQAKPLSPKTINNRIGSLRHLYHALDGRRAWTPVDDLRELDVRPTPMQFVTNALMLTVDANLQRMEQKGQLRTPKHRARFRVLMSTGRRPSEVGRTVRTDLDFDRRIWLPRDGKGGFTPGIYLNDDMLAAWQFFVAVGAWGRIDTERQAEILRDAGWPTGVRPYQGRHTLGITLSEGGTDLDDVGSMMGHKRRETTRKHYVPVLNSRMQRASESLAGRFQGWPSVQTTVQTTLAKHGKSQPKLSHAKRLAPRGTSKKSA